MKPDPSTHCPHCGSQAKGTNFCTDCGKRLPGDVPPEVEATAPTGVTASKPVTEAATSKPGEPGNASSTESSDASDDPVWRRPKVILGAGIALAAVIAVGIGIAVIGSQGNGGSGGSSSGSPAPSLGPGPWGEGQVATFLRPAYEALVPKYGEIMQFDCFQYPTPRVPVPQGIASDHVFLCQAAFQGHPGISPEALPAGAIVGGILGQRQVAFDDAGRVIDESDPPNIRSENRTGQSCTSRPDIPRSASEGYLPDCATLQTMVEYPPLPPVDSSLYGTGSKAAGGTEGTPGTIDQTTTDTSASTATFVKDCYGSACDDRSANGPDNVKQDTTPSPSLYAAVGDAFAPVAVGKTYAPDAVAIGHVCQYSFGSEDLYAFAYARLPGGTNGTAAFHFFGTAGWALVLKNGEVQEAFSENEAEIRAKADEMDAKCTVGSWKD